MLDKIYIEWLKAAADDFIQLLDALYIESRYPIDIGILSYNKSMMWNEFLHKTYVVKFVYC